MKICGDEDLRPRIQKAAYISSRYTRPLIIFDNKSIIRQPAVIGNALRPLALRPLLSQGLPTRIY